MNLWNELQKRCWRNYLETGDYKGSFSHENSLGAKITGETINDFIYGEKCLDIGCGIIPLPYYMRAAPSVKFVGIDPYSGDKEREFEFIRATAEDLPFEDNSFDGVLFATSLDHVKSPGRAVKEAYRVLKKDGYLFVWTGIKKNDEKYQEWVKKKKPAMYDDLHLWAFTNQSILGLLHGFKLVYREFIRPGKNLESVYVCAKK